MAGQPQQQQKHYQYQHQLQPVGQPARSRQHRPSNRRLQQLASKENVRAIHGDNDTTEAEAGCAECEEFYRRHSACMSTACRILSLVYLFCLSTLICVYLARQARNLAQDVAPLGPEVVPENALQCFEYALPLTDAAATRAAEVLLSASACTNKRRQSPTSLMRLQHIDNALLAVYPRSPIDDGSVLVVQSPSINYNSDNNKDALNSAVNKDCGQSASNDALQLINGDYGSSSCGNLTTTWLIGGGCPLSYYLFADMLLRLRLAVRLLRLADELDGAPPFGRISRSSRPILSPATQLDDFGIDSRGQVRLINQARLRTVEEDVQDQSDEDRKNGGCQLHSHANHAVVALLLHDAYDYIPVSTSTNLRPPPPPPPSLRRSLLRGWQQWRRARKLPLSPPPPLALPTWLFLSPTERRAERERLVRAVEESLQSEDPGLASLWWAVCILTGGALAYSLLRYWLCYKLAVCLDCLCQG